MSSSPSYSVAGITLTAIYGKSGWIGGGMLLTDPAIPSGWRDLVAHSVYLASAFGALMVVGIGKGLASRQHTAQTSFELRTEKVTEGKPK